MRKRSSNAKRSFLPRLFLIVKKDREQHAWQFPQVPHVDADPEAPRKGPFPGVRETAETALLSLAGASQGCRRITWNARSQESMLPCVFSVRVGGAGEGLKGYFYSHAPQGFYYYKYETPKEDSFGVRFHFCISLSAL